MSFIYNYAKSDFMSSQLSWIPNSGWKVILIGSGYTPDYNHRYVSSVSSYEKNGEGYISGYNNSGRCSLDNLSIIISETDNKVFIDADNVSWLTLNIGYINSAIIIYETGGVDSTSKLFAHIDDGFPVLTNSGGLYIDWSTSGIAWY